jgi:hypothetical protein
MDCYLEDFTIYDIARQGRGVYSCSSFHYWNRTMISGNSHQPKQSNPGTKLAPKKKPLTNNFVSG